MLSANSNENVAVRKKITVTAENGVVYSGTMSVHDGATITGMTFELTGEGGNTTSVSVRGAGDVKITNNTFGVAENALTNSYYGVYLMEGAARVEVSGNTFNYRTVAMNKDRVAVNVQGNPVINDVKVKDNTLSVVGADAGAGQIVLVNASGNSSSYGITSLEVSGNTVSAQPGAGEKVNAVVVQGVDGLTFTDNTVTGIREAMVLGVASGQNAKNKEVTVGGNALTGTTYAYNLPASSLEDGVIKVSKAEVSNPDKYLSLYMSASVTDKSGAGALYGSVDDAINSVPDDQFGTVKLLKPSISQIVIPENKNITIDLSGKNAAGVNTSAFKVDGKLTITDSSVGALGSVYTNPATHSLIEVGTKGQVSIEAGKFQKPVKDSHLADDKANLSDGSWYVVTDETAAKKDSLSSVTTTDKDGNETTVYFPTVEEAEKYAENKGGDVKPERVNYVVTFDPGYDGGKTSTQRVGVGSSITVPDDPTRDGYVFLGWYVGDNKVDVTYKPSDDVTITAKWQKHSTGGGGSVAPTPKTYTVTFDDGVSHTADLTEKVTSGSKVAKPADPTLKGYVFKGWFADAALTTAYDFDTPVTGDLTLFAKWALATTDPLTFTDVDPKAWYVPGVDFVTSHGLMLGYGDTGLFGVGRTLTRGELAVILARLAAPGYGPEDFRDAKNETGLPDVADGRFYTWAANWAVENGVINGYADAEGNRTGFGPDDPVTMEQLVAIIANLADKEGPDKADAGVLAKFRDPLSVSPWATQSVAWAVERGLVNGSGENGGLYLHGSADIMRERVAVILMNAFHNGILSFE